MAGRMEEDAPPAVARPLLFSSGMASVGRKRSGRPSRLRRATKVLEIRLGLRSGNASGPVILASGSTIVYGFETLLGFFLNDSSVYLTLEAHNLFLVYEVMAGCSPQDGQRATRDLLSACFIVPEVPPTGNCANRRRATKLFLKCYPANQSEYSCRILKYFSSLIPFLLSSTFRKMLPRSGYHTTSIFSPKLGS